MNNLYPVHRAQALLSNLANNAALREQLLQSPRETLSSFGFDIRSDELAASPSIASEIALAETANLIKRQKESEERGTLAIAVFVLK